MNKSGFNTLSNGPYGEGYFRIALTHPAERLAEAMVRLKNLLTQ
jgi:aspartate/methionine/tyrosine aminotransferase